MLSHDLIVQLKRIKTLFMSCQVARLVVVSFLRKMTFGGNKCRLFVRSISEDRLSEISRFGRYSPSAKALEPTYPLVSRAVLMVEA